MKALMFSADYYPEEAGVEEPSKFEKWLDAKLGNEKMEKLVIAFAVVLAVFMSVGLFMLLPTFLASFVTLVTDSVVIRNLVDAVSFVLKEQARVPVDAIEVHVMDVKVRK